MNLNHIKGTCVLLEEFFSIAYVWRGRYQSFIEKVVRKETGVEFDDRLGLRETLALLRGHHPKVLRGYWPLPTFTVMKLLSDMGRQTWVVRHGSC